MKIPKVLHKHIALASGCILLVSVILALLPSPDASAKRTILNVNAIPGPTNNPQNPKLHRLSTPQTVGQPHTTTTRLSDQANIKWAFHKVKRGDTLSGLFLRAGLSNRDVYNITHTAKHANALHHLKPGQLLEFNINKNQELLKLKYIQNKTESYIFTPTKENKQKFTSAHILREFERYPRYTGNTIKHSFYLSGQEAGLSQNMIMKLANIFSWDIDFILDIRRGDSFKVIYEQLYLDGENIKEGEILAAQFTSRGKTVTAIRYNSRSQGPGYFTPDGVNMHKAFLRSPVAFTRISSRFSLGRKHPILHKIRAHKGVDYAASTGTPVKATGAGRISHAARKGGFGNVVEIQHGQGYSTLYAHLSRFGKKIRPGARVKQGQIIGYVGSTGLATGPHLHYEFQVNGIHKDPLRVKFPPALPVPAKERPGFITYARTMTNQLYAYSTSTATNFQANLE